jgi:hypothetical protein
MSVMLSYNPQVAFLPTPTYYYRRNIQSQMNKQDATFKRMSDNFINFMQIHNQTKKNLQIHPEICQTVLSNALYIVLMNIGMVFSWTCRGKKIRKNLNMKEKSKCEKFIENIKGVLKLTNSKIVLPNSW